jgi:ATP-dependent exoDNAse (exonuclease V) alpha subunit
MHRLSNPATNAVATTTTETSKLVEDLHKPTKKQVQGGGGQRKTTTDAKQKTFTKLKGLRIEEILKQITGDENMWTKEQDVAPWLFFIGMVGQTKIKCMGCIPKPDMMHEYSVIYTLKPDRTDPNEKIYKIIRVSSTRRIPLNATMFGNMLRKLLKLPFSEVDRIMGNLSKEALNGNIGKLLAEAGSSNWYKSAETQIDYFFEWYLDELSPPYDRASLDCLRPDTVEDLIRLAVATPWKLCFGWMTGVPLLEELTLQEAEVVAKKFGVVIEHDIKLAANLYHGSQFSNARGDGDSFMELHDLRKYMSSEVFKACLKHKVLKVVFEKLDNSIKIEPGTTITTVNSIQDTPDKGETTNTESTEKVTTTSVTCSSAISTNMQLPPQHQEYMECIYAIGDLECELALVKMMMDAVTAPDDTTKMRPKCAWWPWNDKKAPKPNEEQLIAIERATCSRFAVICGKPGTGKTAMVMKSLFSSFARGQCIGVSFTGMSAQNQKHVAGYGVTAHKIITAWRNAGSDMTGTVQHSYSGRKVLVVEEASTMSLKLMRELLMALGSSIRRIYLFGDYRQMAPVGGGPSLLEALVKRYAGTPVITELKTSMRVTDSTGAFVRDLDRICDYKLKDSFEWSSDPKSGHPFIFLPRGKTDEETVATIKSALVDANVDPDSHDFQVMLHTNAQRKSVMQAWYTTSKFAKLKPFAEHDFMVGERVMFLRNSNSAFRPKGSSFTSDIVMNGTTGTIACIFDEKIDDPSAALVDKTYTGDFKMNTTRRWIGILPQCIRVCLDKYGKKNIERVPPVTASKMQGQETDISILILSKVTPELGSRGVYSTCSRGKKRCFVVSDMDPWNFDVSDRCPSMDFVDTVMSSKNKVPKTFLWKKFPAYPEISKTIVVNPEECVYYKGLSGDVGGSGFTEEEGDVLSNKQYDDGHSSDESESDDQAFGDAFDFKKKKCSVKSEAKKHETSVNKKLPPKKPIASTVVENGRRSKNTAYGILIDKNPKAPIKHASGKNEIDTLVVGRSQEISKEEKEINSERKRKNSGDDDDDSENTSHDCLDDGFEDVEIHDVDKKELIEDEATSGTGNEETTASKSRTEATIQQPIHKLSKKNV